MRFTIGKKLTISFGTIIALSVISTTIAYVKINDMQSNVADMVGNKHPTQSACDNVSKRVHQSLSALRGYIILGGNPKEAERFIADRGASWARIDTSLTELTRLSNAWANDDAIADLDRLNRQIDQLRSAQDRIENLAHTTENIPAVRLYETQVTPLAERMLDTLTAIIDDFDAEQSSEQNSDLLLQLANSRAALARANVNLLSYLDTGEISFREHFQTQWQRFQLARAAISEMASHFSGDQKEWWESFLADTEQFELLPARLFEMRDQPDWNRALYILKTEASPAARDAAATLSSLEEFALAESKAGQAQIESSSSALLIALLATTIIAIVVASSIAVVISRRIVGSVQTLVNRAKQIAAGDLGGESLQINSSDEISDLAVVFNQMVDGLRDLTGQITSVTENINSASAEILASTQQQASSTKEQAATIQQITSTIEEVNQSGGQIIERAKQVAAAAERTSEISTEGVDSVKQTGESMEHIRNQVEEVAQNIVTLSERTQAVGEIVTTVSDIAEQSNLLALNAGIESVTASEQGGRFSVVAGEMKNLADQAKQCTVQVRSILGEIQKGINSSVMLTEEAVKRVEDGKKRSDSTEDTIVQMNDTTKESVQAFQQIIGATNQQQIGFDQVAQGMTDIKQAAEQTSVGTSQLEKAASNLNAMGDQLKTAVGRYRL